LITALTIGLSILGALCRPLQASTYTISAGENLSVSSVGTSGVSVTYTGDLPALVTLDVTINGSVGITDNYMITAYDWLAGVTVNGGLVFIGPQPCGSNSPGFPCSESNQGMEGAYLPLLSLNVRAAVSVSLMASMPPLPDFWETTGKRSMLPNYHQ
jgi:hypothetical protein